MFNSIKQFKIHELAEGQLLFVQPSTPSGVIRQAFYANPELKFVALQMSDGRVAVIRRPDLPVAFLAPMGEVAVGKLPVFANNEWRFGDLQNRFVYTTQPVKVEELKLWLNQFENYVQTIDSTPVETLVKGSIDYTLEIEAGFEMVPGKAYAPKTTPFGTRSRVPTNVREPVTA